MTITRPLKRIAILNAYVHDVTMDEVVNDMEEGLLLTLHVDMIMKLQQDRDFYDIFNKFDVITCDSQIMYFALSSLAPRCPNASRGRITSRNSTCATATIPM